MNSREERIVACVRWARQSMWPVFCLGGVIVTGCTWQPACESLPTPSVVAACLSSVESAENGVSLRIDGTVVATGEGFSSGTCFTPDQDFSARQNLQIGLAPEAIDAFWVEIEDAMGELRTLGFAIPNVESRPQVDDIVKVQYDYSLLEMQSLTASATLFDQDGQMLFYVGQASTPTTLRVPTGITVLEGEAACSSSTECGMEHFYHLEVAVGLETGILPFASSLDVGDTRFVHGGTSMVESGDCSGFESSARVMLGAARL